MKSKGKGARRRKRGALLPMIRHPEGGEAAKDLLSCHPDLVAGKALKLSGSLRAPFFECADFFCIGASPSVRPAGRRFLNTGV